MYAAITRHARALAFIPLALYGVGGPRIPRLQLTQTNAVEIPLDFRVAGAAMGPNGGFMVWSPHDSGVLIGQGGTTHRVCAAARPVAIAYTNSPDLAEIVDARSKAVLSLDSAGRCIEKLPIVTEREIVSAAFFNHEWVIGTVDIHGRSAVSHLSPAGMLQPIDNSTPFAIQFAAAHLVAGQSDLIVSTTRWPFRWSRVNSTASPRQAMQPFTRDTLLQAGRDTAHVAAMLGLAVFALDTGYIQLLADPKTDLRAMLVYAPDGSLTHVTTIDTSMGILSTDPTEHELLMIRRTDKLEIVRYSWRWVPVASHFR